MSLLGNLAAGFAQATGNTLLDQVKQAREKALRAEERQEKYDFMAKQNEYLAERDTRQNEFQTNRDASQNEFKTSQLQSEREWQEQQNRNKANGQLMTDENGRAYQTNSYGDYNYHTPSSSKLDPRTQAKVDVIQSQIKAAYDSPTGADPKQITALKLELDTLLSDGNGSPNPLTVTQDNKRLPGRDNPPAEQQGSTNTAPAAKPESKRQPNTSFTTTEKAEFSVLGNLMGDSYPVIRTQQYEAGSGGNAGNAGVSQVIAAVANNQPIDPEVVRAVYHLLPPQIQQKAVKMLAR